MLTRSSSGSRRNKPTMEEATMPESSVSGKNLGFFSSNPLGLVSPTAADFSYLAPATLNLANESYEKATNFEEELDKGLSSLGDVRYAQPPVAAQQLEGAVNLLSAGVKRLNVALNQTNYRFSHAVLSIRDILVINGIIPGENESIADRGIVQISGGPTLNLFTTLFFPYIMTRALVAHRTTSGKILRYLTQFTATPQKETVEDVYNIRLAFIANVPYAAYTKQVEATQANLANRSTYSLENYYDNGGTWTLIPDGSKCLREYFVNSHAGWSWEAVKAVAEYYVAQFLGTKFRFAGLAVAALDTYFSGTSFGSFSFGESRFMNALSNNPFNVTGYESMFVAK